jgi:hypothetical protein
MISDFGLSKMEESGVMATACGTPGTSSAKKNTGKSNENEVQKFFTIQLQFTSTDLLPRHYK